MLLTRVPVTLENSGATSDAGIVYAGGAALAVRKLNNLRGQAGLREVPQGRVAFSLPIN